MEPEPEQRGRIAASYHSTARCSASRVRLLWIANYDRVEESRRQLLPLKPVYFKPAGS
jgi:hypothetical protein